MANIGATPSGQMVQPFVDYARIAFARYGDRVKHIQGVYSAPMAPVRTFSLVQAREKISNEYNKDMINDEVDVVQVRRRSLSRADTRASALVLGLSF